MVYLHGENRENDLVTSHTKRRYKENKYVKQLPKGDGGGWYTKDEEWCEDHEVDITKTTEAHVNNR